MGVEGGELVIVAENFLYDQSFSVEKLPFSPPPPIKAFIGIQSTWGGDVVPFLIFFSWGSKLTRLDKPWQEVQKTNI